jgi:long-chain acyl-CoA synthetase
VIVGIDAHAAPEQVARALEHSEAAGLVVDTPSNLEKVPPPHRERLRFILLLDQPREHSPGARVRWWRDAQLSAPRRDPASRWEEPTARDPAALVYTSGTTGEPKGIEYTHGQLMMACRSILEEFPGLGKANTVLCWLPMGPLFQRMMNLVASASGATTCFVEDPREIMERIREVKPTVFVAVPRFYEKLHEGIQARLCGQPRWQQRLVEAAMRAGLERSRRQRTGDVIPPALRIRHALLDRLVLRQIRAVMGGRIKWMISGSAPMAPWLLEFFHGVGLLVLEAYGLSENPVPIAANRPHAYRFGSVGRPFRMNELRIAEDGELLVKGPGVFRAYYREGRPADRFTPDGYYHTGDFARLDEDGFLFLVGRKSEIIKTSTGRRISPAQVEAVYRRSPYLDEVVVVGNSRKHLAALVTLNAPAVQTVLERAGIRLPSRIELATLPFVRELIGRELVQHGRTLSAHEQVRAFEILPEPLSIAAGELTTTLKPRRDQIEARHRELIERLYDESRPATLSVEAGAARTEAPAPR